MIRVLAFFIIFFVAEISSAITSCEADLNGDGICDPYIVKALEEDGTVSRITIDVGGSDKSVSGDFELGNGGLSAGYLSGEFSLLLDFYTRKTDLTKYSFRWDAVRQDWILYKKSTWLEPSRDEKYTLEGEKAPVDASFPQQFDVERVVCCTLFSQFSNGGPNFKFMNDSERLLEIKKDFKYILKYISQGEKGNLFYGVDETGKIIKRNIPQDFVYELTLIVSDENVGSLNDYAYYLYRNHDYVLAAILLKEIHKKYPERVVAILNLADAYWEIGMKSEACPLYSEYIEKMTRNGKGARIPQLAKSRVSCH